MAKEDLESQIKHLKEENMELKEIIAIALNKPLLRELAESIENIEKGDYYTEEKFAKKHHLVTA